MSPIAILEYWIANRETPPPAHLYGRAVHVRRRSGISNYILRGLSVDGCMPEATLEALEWSVERGTEPSGEMDTLPASWIEGIA